MSRTNTDLEKMRHSFAHVLAFAVMRLFPDTKLGVGPVVENGFYQDFQFSKPITEETLSRITNEMDAIIDEDIPFHQIFVEKSQAFDILHLQGQIFKTEILNSIQDEEVSFFKTGDNFMDLCKGPHVENTGKLGSYRLIGITTNHWDNDESRPLLQRIHGIAFQNEADLKKYLEDQIERREKDHKAIAARLELYTFSSEAGAGLPIWLPNGFAIKRIIMDYIQKMNIKSGSNYVTTPSIIQSNLAEKYGMTELDKDNIHNPLIEGENKFVLRPNSLVQHIQVFKSKKRSYKNLPFRISELAQTFRNENSSKLSGLARVREYTADANTIICTEDQIKEELKKALSTIKKIYEDFGIKDFQTELNLPNNTPENYEGTPKIWDKLIDKFIKASKDLGMTIYEIPNSAEKVGPSITFKVKDVFDREWKLGSIIIDLRAPKAFNLEYITEKDKTKEPFIIRRTAIGSVERFFAILLEQLSGEFPLWLSPVQVNIIPISEKFIEYAEKVKAILVENKINVQVDSHSETMQNKIRKAQENMIPYMLIVGEKEEENNTVSVRPRSGQDLGMMRIEEFVSKIMQEIEDKIVF